MLQKISFITLVLIFTIKPTLGDHLGLKGNVKSDKPSCGQTLMPGTRSNLINLFRRGCHGRYVERGGIEYKGEMSADRYSIFFQGKGELYSDGGYTWRGEFEDDKFVFGAVYQNGKFLAEGVWKDWKLIERKPTPYSPANKTASAAPKKNKKENSQSNGSQGNAKAQYQLALSYETGNGQLQDFIYAHMWANISASNGYSKAVTLRDRLAKKMTASQIEKAQDLARQCRNKNYKGC